MGKEIKGNKGKVGNCSYDRGRYYFVNFFLERYVLCFVFVI